MTTNPYSEQTPSTDHVRPSSIRPGGITVVGVLTLILAGLGTIGAIFGLGGQLVSGPIAQSIIDQSEANPENESLRLQADMQRRALATAQKYQVPNFVSNILSLLVCGALIIAAIMLMTGSAKGRTLLLSLFFVVILADIGKSILQYSVQKETMSLMGEGFKEGFKAGASSQGGEVPEEADAALDTAMRIGAIVGLVFMVVWLILKIVFYLWARSYLNKPEVAAWFQARQSQAA